MDIFERLARIIWADKGIQLTAVAVMADTVFGLLRAARQRELNSSFGIDGAVRKTAMLLSLVFLAILDRTAGTDIANLLPGRAQIFGRGAKVGTSQFFAALYISYEILSSLKNLALCGLPVAPLQRGLEKLLTKYTDELEGR